MVELEYRRLGRTNLKVSAIGLGTEYLHNVPRETVISVVHEALDRGVNYIDLLFGTPHYRDNFYEALSGKREKVFIAGHLGSVEEDGQYLRSRDVKLCEQYFHDLLTRLHTDYIDVLMLHYVDQEEDYQEISKSGGMLELAIRLKEEGKARFIGMSSHRASLAQKVVESGIIDVLMFPVNPAFDVLPENTRFEDLWDEAAIASPEILTQYAQSNRKKLYHACMVHDVAVVAMKPYAGGWLFAPTNDSSAPLTPVQCLSYCLAQTAVSTVVPGVKNIEELRAALDYIDATNEAKDFTSVVSDSRWNLQGSCMYCNHCLPCPSGIDIGKTMGIIDSALIAQNTYGSVPDKILASYNALAVKASACIECGACEQRCPFGVTVMSKMKEGTRLLEDI